MSDLHCPATLLLARHGDADYVETWFSDEGGWLNAEGRRQSHELARRVRDRRVARVLASDTSRAVQTAELVAADLALAGGVVETRRRLREVFVGDLLGTPFDVRRLREVTDRWLAGDLDARFPGGESGHDVARRYAAELTALADEHRGESVLVVAHQIATAVALPVLCGLPPAAARGRDLANGDHAELSHDADGWRLVAWSAGVSP